MTNAQIIQWFDTEMAGRTSADMANFTRKVQEATAPMIRQHLTPAQRQQKFGEVLRSVAAEMFGVPPPASLIAAIQGDPPTLQPTAANAHGVPGAPDLITAIQAARRLR